MKEVNRTALALYDVQEFKSWLSFQGWTIEKIKDENELVRATLDEYEQPLVIYKHINDAIFAIVPEIWYDIVCQFYTEKAQREASGCSAEAKKKLLSIIEDLRSQLCSLCVSAGRFNCGNCRYTEDLIQKARDIADS